MIFHITTHMAWDEAKNSGEYRAASLLTEGFIHCSTLSQVVPVANLYYKGYDGLILLMIEPALLSSDLKWEAPSGGTPPPGVPEPPPGVPEGDQFPHVYGPINLDAVVSASDFIRDANGEWVLPSS
jgi:uncharacterized protein (DUF952 family)